MRLAPQVGLPLYSHRVWWQTHASFSGCVAQRHVCTKVDTQITTRGYSCLQQRGPEKIQNIQNLLKGKAPPHNVIWNCITKIIPDAWWLGNGLLMCIIALSIYPKGWDAHAHMHTHKHTRPCTHMLRVWSHAHAYLTPVMFKGGVCSYIYPVHFKVSFSRNTLSIYFSTNTWQLLIILSWKSEGR